MRFPFLGGEIEAKSAPFTFAECAGLQPHLLVADYDAADATTRIRSHQVHSQDECFEPLERYVAAKPWLWERLIELQVSRVSWPLYDRMLEARRLASQGHAAESTPRAAMPTTACGYK